MYWSSSFFSPSIYSSSFSDTIPASHPLFLSAVKWTNKSRNRPEEKRILSHTKYFRARNRAEYFMQCIIWLDVPSFREIYDRASLPVGPVFRYARECFTSPLGFYFPSVNPVPYPRNILAVKYVCMYMYARHTRRHVSVGDAATWVNLPARCRARFPLMQLYV